jgi:energy-coupling factor transporter ATP-binding protein EcfA2
MPTLFISYKRGTTVVAPLMQRLRAAKYRLWFDRDEIHLGDPDWRGRIDQGLTICDAVILNITPAACESEPVQYEVKKARELGKPIFPIILERIADYSAAIRDLGLAERQHIEDFTDVTRWDEQIERLLHDLRSHGFVVTRHTKRQMRGEKEYSLHQQYLKKVADEVGDLNLGQIVPDERKGVPLERVYVDSPTLLSLSVEVQDWKIVDWWVSTPGESYEKTESVGATRRVAPTKHSPADLGYETAALEALLPKIEQRIEDYRKRNPRYTPTEPSYNSWKNGPHENVLTLNVQDIAAARNRLVILGAPGSGKSTFVRHLALCLAGAQIDGWDREANLTTIGQWPHRELTPIYIELRRFVASDYFPADIDQMPTLEHLWRYIEAEILGADLAAYLGELKLDMQEGHAVLILDGLDEVPYPEGQLKQRQEQLQALADRLNGENTRKSRVIVASRPHAYEGWTLPGFEAVTIAAFEDAHRVELATRLYRETGLSEADASEKAQGLNRALGAVDPDLKDRPLFVTLMATIYRQNEGLPTRRGALYRRSILLLLERWTQSKTDAPSLPEILGDKTLENLYDRLAALAFEVHQEYGEQPGTPEIAYESLIKHLKPLGKHTAVDLVSYLSENAGVLVSPGQDAEKDVFRFAHRTFQEYLAAAHITAECLQADKFDHVRQLIESKPLAWREPGTLVGDVLTDTAVTVVKRDSDLWQLIDDLLPDDAPETLKDAAGFDPRCWSAWLAAQIALEQELYRQNVGRGERAIRQNLVNWLRLLVETADALSPVDRASCGRALGLLGDPREGVGVGVGAEYIAPLHGRAPLPDMAWCRVPAGDFLYGDKKEKTPLRYDFEIAKYPVTYAQYEAFVSDGGYHQSDYWTKAGWDWKGEKTKPEVYWNDPRWHIANHPVVGVTWYEAAAFCNWLTARTQPEAWAEYLTMFRAGRDDESSVGAQGDARAQYIAPHMHQVKDKKKAVDHLKDERVVWKGEKLKQERA